MLKNLSLLAMLSVFVMSLAACNTIEGAAQGGKEDIKGTADAIEDATD